MKDNMTYCGWTGSVEFSEEDGVLHGKLLGTDDLISYEGETVASLVQDFHESVDEYIDFCVQQGKPALPQDTTNIPVKLELYRGLAETAQQKNMPVQAYIEQSLWHSVELKAS